MQISTVDPSRRAARFRRLVAVSCGALLLMLAAAPLLGASQPVPTEQWRTVLEGWSADLEEARKLLQEGKHRKVRSLMDVQLPEMAQRFRTGEIAGQFLGTGLALRAIAYAGVGDIESAAWDWGVARSLAPELDQLDRRQFGAAGAFLESDEYKALFERLHEGGSEAPHDSMDGRGNPDGIEPPRKKVAPAPRYPRGKRDACVEEPLVIMVVIGRDGRPYAPTLVTKSDPVLFFTTAETLRGWRFAPARLDGRPVPAFYHLTVNYKTMLCDTRFEGR